MHAETIEQLVGLPWRAVVLGHFKEEMRTTPKILNLIAVPYVRTDLQFRFAWCMTGQTMGEYDSEERKRSKEEKDPRRSGSSVCETERRSLFRLVHVRTNIGASVEYLCQKV